jgi:hypothetical protein
MDTETRRSGRVAARVAAVVVPESPVVAAAPAKARSRKSSRQIFTFQKSVKEKTKVVKKPPPKKVCLQSLFFNVLLLCRSTKNIAFPKFVLELCHSPLLFIILISCTLLETH